MLEYVLVEGKKIVVEKTIYVFSNGELKRKDNTLSFESTSGRKFIPVEVTREILLFGEVSLNTNLLSFLSQHEIILHYFNYYGYYAGSAYPREHLSSGEMTLRQSEHYLDSVKRVDLAQRFVSGAALNIRRVLKYYDNRGKDVLRSLSRVEELISAIEGQTSIPQLMAIEGNVREAYYNAFDAILEEKEFAFDGRNRRPPRDPLNALISFGNSILYTTVLGEIYKTHLDPRIGYLHSTNTRRFSLNLDVSEIFKPVLVDRIIMTLVAKRILKAHDFERDSGGIFLREKGRELFLRQWDERLAQTIQHREIGRPVSYRRLIRLELYKLEKHLLGEKQYEPFITQW